MPDSSKPKSTTSRRRPNPDAKAYRDRVQRINEKTLDDLRANIKTSTQAKAKFVGRERPFQPDGGLFLGGSPVPNRDPGKSGYWLVMRKYGQRVECLTQPHNWGYGREPSGTLWTDELFESFLFTEDQANDNIEKLTAVQPDTRYHFYTRPFDAVFKAIQNLRDEEMLTLALAS